MIEVRDVFSKAYGEVPEGATCHVGSRSERDDCEHIQATIGLGGIVALQWIDGDWNNPLGDKDYEHPFGPDISTRPAESFRGFFGKEYDDALEELRLDRDLANFERGYAEHKKQEAELAEKEDVTPTWYEVESPGTMGWETLKTFDGEDDEIFHVLDDAKEEASAQYDTYRIVKVTQDRKVVS